MPRSLALAIAAAFFAVLVGLVTLGDVPVILLAAYALLSAVALVLYRRDKSAAVHSRRRTPESTLHTISLLGGWPGALVARHVFRHKTRKQPFRSVFWCTALANCAALALLAYTLAA